MTETLEVGGRQSGKWLTSALHTLIVAKYAECVTVFTNDVVMERLRYSKLALHHGCLPALANINFIGPEKGTEE